MQLSDFDYSLPEELIATHPAPQRSGSRLMCVDKAGGQIQHRVFHQLSELLRPEDLLVFNDTRVIPARLFGRKQTGGKIEVLVERLLDENSILAQIRASKSPITDSILNFPKNDGSQQRVITATVLGREGDFFKLKFDTPVLPVLDEIGHIPLPPYINRADEDADKERYQTVYGYKKGAVAAPTAGLHFDDELLAVLKARGVEFGFVTLHVGAGTFAPVRVTNIKDHQMHSEYIEVSESLCQQVRQCRERGGRVIAVGTTSVRCLESAAVNESLQPTSGETDIFIYPGYQFRIVDAMITNFHLPQSTLLMLVSAFIGRDRMLAAYNLAVAEKYRFFSYGDAMFLAEL